MSAPRMPDTLRRLLVLSLASTIALVTPKTVTAEDPSAAKEAEEAVRHAEAGNGPALAAIAQDSIYDVWLIADELLAMDRPDVARTLAEALRSPEDRTALLRQLARERGGDAGGRRKRFAEIEEIPDDRVVEQLVGLASLLPPARLDADLLSILDGRIAYALANAAPKAFEDPAAVLAAYRQGVRLARRIGWSVLELRLTAELAAWAQGADRLGEARSDLDAVIPLARGREGWADMADVLYAYGALQMEGGESESASGYLRDAALIYSKAGNQVEEARTLSFLGSVLLECGNVAEALEVQLRAGALAEQAVVRDSTVVDEIQVATAAVYESLGMLSEAEGLLGGLLARLEAAPGADPWHLTAARGNLGRVRFLRGEATLALDDFQACERLYRELGSVGQALDALALQAWCDAGPERTRPVREQLEQALARGSAEVSPLQRSNLAEALARCHLREGRADDAVATLQPVFDSLRDIEAHHTQQVDVPGEYGAALVAAGRFADALKPIDDCVSGLLANVDGLEVASARTYRGIVAAEALAAGIRAASELKDPDRLWFYMESARAIRLLAALGGRSRVEESILPPDLRQRLQDASEAALAARQDLARASSATETRGVDLAPLRAARLVADAKRDSVANAVKTTVQLADLKELARGARLVGLAALRRALRPDEVVVSLSGTLPGDTIEALVITRDAAPVARALVGRGDMAAAVRALRAWRADAASAAASAEQPPAPRPLSAQLDRLRALLEPLDLPATAGRVLVVPDAELAYIPFAAVWPQHDVALLPCGSLLEYVRPFMLRRSGTRALALGISDYSTRGLLAVDQTLLARLTPTLVRGGAMTLPSLRFSVQEARQVAGSDGELLLNPDATSGRLLELLAWPDAPVWTTIHFACHGLVNADHPGLSGLALTDGLLTAQEIFSLRLKTDMVVLSACATATDPYVMGEGLSGLVRAFLQAGAPRVVASLWDVPDEPTAVLMKHFYELLRAEPNISPSTALRRAQAKVRKSWPSPENWAAWTLWGAL